MVKGDDAEGGRLNKCFGNKGAVNPIQNQIKFHRLG